MGVKFGQFKKKSVRGLRRKIEDRRTLGIYVDGEHNRVVRIWLCGGNEEDI